MLELQDDLMTPRKNIIENLLYPKWSLVIVEGKFDCFTLVPAVFPSDPYQSHTPSRLPLWGLRVRWLLLWLRWNFVRPLDHAIECNQRWWLYLLDGIVHQCQYFIKRRLIFFKLQHKLSDLSSGEKYREVKATSALPFYTKYLV